MNLWGEQINLVGETHCGIGMKVYDKSYVSIIIILWYFCIFIIIIFH